MAVLRARSVITSSKGDNHEQDAGNNIVQCAIEELLHQIVNNHGYNAAIGRGWHGLA